MGTDISQKRMTETRTGRAACVLLALVWLVSMSVGDVHAYSYVPMLAGLALVILLALSAMIRGAKVVQMSLTGWFSLAVGVYFLVRCLCSFSVVESWREASIILGCGVFYVGGIYAAQGRSLRPVLTLLVVAIVLNVAAFAFTQRTNLPMDWLGRPSVGPGGMNHRPVTLFIYKNFAGTFLLVTGMMGCVLAWLLRLHVLPRIALLLLGCGACYVATQCGTRSIYVLPPLMLPVIGAMWVVFRLYTEDAPGLLVYLCGFAVVAVICVGGMLVLCDSDLFSHITTIDSHGRFYSWKVVCRFLPDAPLWGYGASSVQWLALPYFDMNCNSLNYAHNEYLQAWADYGVLGVAAVIGVLGCHMVRAFRIVASERTVPQQRLLTIAAAFVVICWSVSSLVDFFWHNFAIATMTAFCVGVLASPYASEKRGRLLFPSASGKKGKGVLAFAGVIAFSVCLWLAFLCYPVWSRQWEFNNLSRPGADEDGEARRAMISELLPEYPSSLLVDEYVRIPRAGDPWKEDMRLFRMALEGNPRQLCVVTMMGKTLTDHGMYEEAELLYRRNYPGDGPSSTFMMDWMSFYALNLFRWGQSCIAHGDLAGAHSRIAHALKVVDKNRYPAFERLPETHGSIIPQWSLFLQRRRQDVSVMEQIGTPKDDSWMQPMEPGGKPALYSRFAISQDAEKTAKGQ